MHRTSSSCSKIDENIARNKFLYYDDDFYWVLVGPLPSYLCAFWMPKKHSSRLLEAEWTLIRVLRMTRNKCNQARSYGKTENHVTACERREKLSRILEWVVFMLHWSARNTSSGTMIYLFRFDNLRVLSDLFLFWYEHTHFYDRIAVVSSEIRVCLLFLLLLDYWFWVSMSIYVSISTSVNLFYWLLFFPPLFSLFLFFCLFAWAYIRLLKWMLSNGSWHSFNFPWSIEFGFELKMTWKVQLIAVYVIWLIYGTVNNPLCKANWIHNL